MTMLQIFIDALKFASEKHLEQRKKGCEMIPYVNHLINVAHILFHSGETDYEVLSAALLHDILEDTNTSENELQILFGKRVKNLVIELTDNMKLTYEDRMIKQMKKAPMLSSDAKKIKIADKIANISDFLTYDFTWSHERKVKYLEWSQKIVEGCRGVDPGLEYQFDEIISKGNKMLGTNS